MWPRPDDRTPPLAGAARQTPAVYGPAIWVVMSLVVIPFLTGRPPTVTYRWWIQLAGHAAFVGLPIVATIARGEAGGRAAARTAVA